MKKAIQTLLIILFTLFCLPALSEQVRQLSWDDLIPAHLLADDPLAKLSQDAAKLNQEQQDLVYWVLNMLETLPERGPETEETYKKVDSAKLELKKVGIDIDEVMAKRKVLSTAIVNELNGQHVRIPGYLLPLEVSGTKVTEFLLVPYIGACIHVPPPPPNQIVHVKVAPEKGYTVKRLYEAVWVSGKIVVKQMVKDLFLVDGSTGVDIGYSMQASRIDPYEE